MKGLFLIIGCMLISISVFSQSERWKQKNARINFAFTPQFEFVNIAGKYNPTASLCGSIVFNSKYYFGGYATKKVLPSYTMYQANPTQEIDVNYQHLGIEFLYAMGLGLYRTKGGHYVHRRLKIDFSGRFGGGALWLDNIDKQKISSREYFFVVQPQVGVSYPVNDFISLGGGACYPIPIHLTKFSTYFESKDFSGPGAYISAKITIFR
jgi:hypothetical protein